MFSDVSTSQGLVQDITFLTRTDTTQYPLADRVRSINSWYHKVVTMILQSQDGWDFDDTNFTDFPILTTPMVASQRDYAIPVSEKVLKIKRLDVTYDGNKYYKAEPIDINEIGVGMGNTTDEDALFDKTKPVYDLITNSIWLYPLADATDVANGAELRVTWYREIDEFTASDTTQEPGFDEPFHRMLSIGASLDYALAFGLPNKNDLAALMADYEERLKAYYGKKQLDREYILKPAYQNYG